MATAEKDDEAREVLLKGKGVSFCAGLDLSPENELFAFGPQAPSAFNKVAFYREVRRVQGTHTRLERLIRPTIAVIEKHCLGAGLELVLCCDIRLCTQDTLFSLPEARLGFITDVGGLQRLNRVVVDRARAREISFRSHRFDARKALEIGLVNEIYPDEAPKRSMRIAKSARAHSKDDETVGLSTRSGNGIEVRCGQGSVVAISSDPGAASGWPRTRTQNTIRDILTSA